MVILIRCFFFLYSYSLLLIFHMWNIHLSIFDICFFANWQLFFVVHFPVKDSFALFNVSDPTDIPALL